jgi:hypothetical protein
MPAWQRCFRLGFAPLMSTRALEALLYALVNDDERLITGATTSPPPLQSLHEWPVESACPIGYSGWQGEGLATVGAVESYFAELCYSADQRLGEPGGCRYLICWIDETPRDEMRRELSGEVEAELARRSLTLAPTTAA